MKLPKKCTPSEIGRRWNARYRNIFEYLPQWWQRSAARAHYTGHCRNSASDSYRNDSTVGVLLFFFSANASVRSSQCNARVALLSAWHVVVCSFLSLCVREWAWIACAFFFLHNIHSSHTWFYLNWDLQFIYVSNWTTTSKMIRSAQRIQFNLMERRLNNW